MKNRPWRYLFGAIAALATVGVTLLPSCADNDLCPGEHSCGLQGCSVNGVCPAPAGSPTATSSGAKDASKD